MRSEKMERRIALGDVVQIIEDLKTEERINCDIFCERNSGAANDERRHDATMILNALNMVLYELNALND